MIFLIVGLILVLFKSILYRLVPSTRAALKIRYLILLMGLFSTYCGLIYNDMMALPIGFFKSCYYSEYGNTQIIHDCVYPVGVDSIWSISRNELAYMNSLKMKLSVILGIMQMSLGVCLKACNAIHFKNYVDLFHEFIPQILLLTVLFGYMDLLIVLKWLTNYSGIESMAPSVITTMINIPLDMGKIEGLAFFGTHTSNKAVSLLFFCK